MKLKLQEQTCLRCPDHLYCTSPSPVKQKGAIMHFGEQFCTGGKRARRFQRRDPKKRVPSWCPKRKTPRELRIYGFKDTESWLLHEQLCHSLKHEISPEGRRYAVKHELTTDLTAREFLKRCVQESDVALLGVDIPMHSVVEIDDGLQRICFYKTLDGYRYEPFFRTELTSSKPIDHTEESIWEK